ncbi:hypothetical protein Glove_131g21 [Diversispora epigaea]|uniref:Uncharacterized protein n=1 Tax=Diversispora epigaea TaxID=1348612 RepID=A0A397J0G6_9GLOM|nr:hypothetical protein Glove_131g21 [Diversispora epigaea]
MGKISIPLEAYNENVKQENFKIQHLQNERCDLIEIILYQDPIDKLLQKWKDIIRKIACDAIPKRIGVQWLSNWSSHLEIRINNYKCSGIWYQEFLTAINLNSSSTQRLVTYLLLQNVIKLVFNRNSIQNHLDTHFSADPYLVLQKIIEFEPAEASKFSYIIRWIVYKLTKSDHTTRSHSKFETICVHLKILNSEVIVYDQNIRSQVTNIIPGQDFLNFMYRMESIVLLLFEKYEEFGPNILQYIHNSLLCNLFLLNSFYILFNISNQKLDTNNNISTELTDETKDFLYERIISIYMKSRQKSWRRFNEFIPEKGTSSLRENLKAMHKDIKIENKLASIKKSNIPKDPILGHIWWMLKKNFLKYF